MSERARQLDHVHRAQEAIHSARFELQELVDDYGDSMPYFARVLVNDLLDELGSDETSAAELRRLIKHRETS